MRRGRWGEEAAGTVLKRWVLPEVVWIRTLALPFATYGGKSLDLSDPHLL